MALEIKRRRFTVKEYYRMAEAGILGEDDRVELLDGEIVEMTPIGRRHALSVAQLTKQMEHAFGGFARVVVQNPVRLGRRTEPQPDLMLVRLDPDPYLVGHPGPEDVLLLVEVGDSTVEFDRRIKLPLYARAGVREVWLVDLAQEIVVAYSDPTTRSYRSTRLLHRGDRIAPGAFPDRDLAVADFLPE